MLEDLRMWMSEKVVPWMLHIYARGATTRRFCATFFRVVLFDDSITSGGGENDVAGRWVALRFPYQQDPMRFEVRLCSLFTLVVPTESILPRTKEIFDIIIDFPDSMGALYDLRVRYPNFFSNSTMLIEVCLPSGLPPAR
jgi:anaphase-promoting complex subunit 2